MREEPGGAPDSRKENTVYSRNVDPDRVDSGEAICLAVIEELASLLGTDFTEMRPVQNAIDLDCLAGLLDDDGQFVEVTFVYEGLLVTVSSEYVVTVTIPNE